jgi:hypothetical protein
MIIPGLPHQHEESIAAWGLLLCSSQMCNVTFCNMPRVSCLRRHFLQLRPFQIRQGMSAPQVQQDSTTAESVRQSIVMCPYRNFTYACRCPQCTCNLRKAMSAGMHHQSNSMLLCANTQEPLCCYLAGKSNFHVKFQSRTRLCKPTDLCLTPNGWNLLGSTHLAATYARPNSSCTN